MNPAAPACGRLVAASQDLESSLGNMRLIADLLLREDGSLPGAMRREYLGALVEKAGRLQGVAEDMTALAKIQARQVRLERCPLHISEILLQAIEAFSSEATRKQIVIRSAIADEEPQIAADYWKLSRALGGVMESMIRAASPGASIAINVEPTAEGVQIVFRRLGSMVALNQGVCFFPGEREASAAELGLSLSEQLVALHGGMLEAREDEAGQSSSVTIRLPGMQPA